MDALIIRNYFAVYIRAPDVHIKLVRYTTNSCDDRGPKNAAKDDFFDCGT